MVMGLGDCTVVPDNNDMQATTPSMPMHPPMVDKSGQRIQRMFGSIAPVYDLLNHLLSLNIDRRWRNQTVKLVPPGSDGPILDLCTGTGDLALAYSRASQGRVPIVGADFCGPMLDRACRKSQRKHVVGISYTQADAMHLPFPDNAFQIVCVAFGLRNIADTDRGLAEIVRVTRPGGRVAVLEFSKPQGSLLSGCYQAYFKYVLPLIGQLISRSKDQAYSYLPQSVMSFPEGEALLKRMQQHGLQQTFYKPFTFGIASLYVGVKP